MNFIAFIPTRYASKHFPNKPFALLGGKPIIERVCEQVAGVLDDAVVNVQGDAPYPRCCAWRSNNFKRGR